MMIKNNTDALFDNSEFVFFLIVRSLVISGFDDIKSIWKRSVFENMNTPVSDIIVDESDWNFVLY